MRYLASACGKWVILTPVKTEVSGYLTNDDRGIVESVGPDCPDSFKTLVTETVLYHGPKTEYGEYIIVSHEQILCEV